MSAPSSCLSDEQLRALLQGAPEATSPEWMAHLNDCVRCRDRLDALTGGGERLQGMHRPTPAVSVSPPLRDAMDRLKASEGTIRIGAEETTPLLGTKVRYLGDYEIIEELGRGGMGVVYRARQLSLRREVAIKVILAGQLASPADVRRFHVEAEAAAKLDHPNIVPIFEIGEHEGHHFFSMKLVEGGSLAGRITPAMDQRSSADKLDIRDSALVIAQIARAVHYAHQRGVLHRDLKPSNILIDRDGQPHLTDFGLAKMLEHDSGLTYSGAVMGTPNYLAPELAAGKAKEVTTAADVFSLGAVLYELLTGRPPFKEETVAATLQSVLTKEPPAPSDLDSSVARDLETIVLKGLEKEPSRRYRSALEFAEDLEHFLRHEPISARPTTMAERAWRWCRRKPALAGSLAALFGALILGMTGIIWQWQRAEGTAISEKLQRQRADTNALAATEQRNIAQQETHKAQQAVTRLEIERAESLLQAGDSSKGLAYLARLLRQQPTNGLVAERLMSALSWRSICLPIAPLRHGKPLNSLTGIRRQELKGTYAFSRASSIVSIHFNSDGSLMVTASKDGTARLWNTLNGEPVGQPLRHDGEVIGAQFSPDNQQVVTVSVDGTARIWKTDTCEPVVPSLVHEHAVHFAAFSGDGQQVVTASQDKTVRIWNTRTGEQIGESLLHLNAAYFACFSPDGTRILSADQGNKARLWDSRTRKLMASADHFYFNDYSFPYPQFSPVLDQVATLRFHYARLRRLPSLDESFRLNHDSYVYGAVYSSDGQRVATISEDTTAQVWDARTGEGTGVRLRHLDRLNSADFSSDGQRIATGSRDKSARVWNVRSGSAETEPILHEQSVISVRLAPGGQRLATITENETAWLWDVRTLHPLATLRWMQSAARLAVFSADGRRLAIANEVDNVRICDVQSGRLIGKTMRHAASYPIRDLQFSPDGARLVTTADDRVAQVWDGKTGDPIGQPLRHPGGLTHAKFSPDGQRVLTGCNDGAARVWDLGSSKLLFEVRHAERVDGIDFSPDGRMIVTGSRDRTAQISDALTGRPLCKPFKHDGAIYCVVFDPAGQRVATASKDKSVRIWSIASDTMLVPPLVHPAALHDRDSVVFSPDGSRLLTIAGSAVQIWDSKTGRATTPPLNHGGSVVSGRFSPAGERVLTASADGMARLWDVETGHAISEPLHHGSRVTTANFSPDGLRVMTCSSDKGIRILDVIRAPLPVPAWLPTLAEAVAGQHVGFSEMSEVVSVEELYRLRQQLAGNAEQTYYGQWARWFFADSAMRTISPHSGVTVQEYAQRRITESTFESLTEGTRLSPTNAPAFARLAQTLLATNQIARTALLDDAEWFSRHATDLAPRDSQVLSIRKAVLQRLNSPSPGGVIKSG